MGVLKNGVFGGFVNRTGGLVGRMVGKQNVISAVRHNKHTKVGTPAQLEQQLKFVLVVDFLSRCNRLIKVGFAEGSRRSAFNAALKYNLRKIVTGVWPDYRIDFSKVVYSRGCLAGTNCPTVSLETDRLLVNWLPHEQLLLNQNSDLASFLAYSEALEVAVMEMDCARRDTLGYVLELPVGMTGFPVYAYMSFASVDERERSNSVYLGVFGPA